MKVFLLYITLFIMLSCTQEEVVPDYVITEDKMIAVLVDMELKQAEIKYKMARIDTRSTNYKSEYEKVLENHQLSFQTFNQNLDYYCSKPLLMQDIYLEVIELLSENQSSIKPNHPK